MFRLIAASLSLAGLWLTLRMSALPAVTELPPPRTVPTGERFSVAAAGDIAGPWSGDVDTALLLEQLTKSHQLAAILALGDLQYPRGDYADYRRDFEASWGRPSLRALLRPVPGNHDYAKLFGTADGYFDWFNGAGERHGQAGTRGHGYYSFELGDWQFLAINTSDECRAVPCNFGSAMYRWLEAELEQRTRPCVLAYFHHPRFHALDHHADSRSVAPLWSLLFEHGADIALSGHAHAFQALAPLDAHGEIDRERGIRSFVVGTGGAPLHPTRVVRRGDALEALVSDEQGVLLLDFAGRDYDWQFVSADPGRRGQVRARGSGRCRD